MDFKITHGRKNQPGEYLEIKLQKPRLNIVVQKTRALWHAYLIEIGKSGAVRTFWLL